MQAGTIHLIDRVGCFRPKIETLDALGPGEIGFITAQIKEVSQTAVGDTITDAKRPTAAPLPGFKEAQPVVFCGLFPVDANDFEKLRESMYKLRLNDASFSFEMETRSEEHTSELQSLMRISYAVFCLKKKKTQQTNEYDK